MGPCMNRRRFLQASLFAAALAPAARAATGEPERASGGFKVGKGKDRRAEELLIMGGAFDLKVSARDTGGEFCLYDTLRHAKGGPAFHKHHAQDEWFYVLRGEFIVRVGDVTEQLGPGDSAFAPRKIPHAFAMTSEGEGQMLVMFSPAGTMEEFFHGMAATFGQGIPAGREDAMRKLWQDHGMEIVGPPLKF
jgi:mannose-6-phosphate isomerase-like protein (cupin superfamily)